MPNQFQTKPHVLTITVDPGCSGCVSDDPSLWCESWGKPARCMRYEIECPYDEAGRENVCVAVIECMCPPIFEPGMPEPTRAPWLTESRCWAPCIGNTGYVYGADIIAVAAWAAYHERMDDHADEHPSGWKPTGQCWAATGDHCWPEPLEDSGIPANTPGTFRVWVDNEGSYDESVLALSLWEEVDGEQEPARQSA